MSDFRYAPTETPPELRSEFNIQNPKIVGNPVANDSSHAIARPDDGTSTEQSISGVWRSAPNPVIGGEPGRGLGLGFTVGMNPHGYYHQPFTGDVMTVQSPNLITDGPIGVRDHAGRLAAGIHQQYSNPIPTPEDVAGMFAGRTFKNPLLNPDGTVGG